MFSCKVNHKRCLTRLADFSGQVYVIMVMWMGGNVDGFIAPCIGEVQKGLASATGHVKVGIS